MIGPRIATRDYARPQRAKPAPQRRQPARKQAQGKRAGGSAALGLPLWAWMVVSFSLLVFGAALYYISRPVTPMDLVPSSHGKVAAKTIEIPPKEPARFGFYEMLPSYEVVVPEEVLNPSKPKPGRTANNLPPRPVPTTPAEPADHPASTAALSMADIEKPAATATAKSAAAVAATAVKPAAEPAAPREAPAAPQPTAQLAQGERFLIQVAAFRTRADAEQRVAALTLAGLAARIEQVTIDNKDTWFRVRLGPYGSAAAAADAQQTLKTQGFSGVVMKVRS